MSEIMKFFCPYCWAELDRDYEICPNCKSSLKDFTNLEFDDKLILGLDNPITENRLFIINVLGRRKVEKAIKKLCHMLFDKRDTYELMEIINALYLIGSTQAISCIREANNRVLENKILSNFIERLLCKLDK